MRTFGRVARDLPHLLEQTLHGIIRIPPAFGSVVTSADGICPHRSIRREKQGPWLTAAVPQAENLSGKAGTRTVTSRNKRPDPSPELTAVRAERDKLRSQFITFADLSRRLTATLDPAELLVEVIDDACAITDARYGALGVFGADGRIEEFVTHGITEEERAAIGALPEGRGLLGLLQQRPEVIRVRNIAEHAASVGFPPNHPPMRSFMGAPILLEGEALGNLYLTEKQSGGEFTDDDESMLLALADLAARAIHNARLHQAVDEERARLRTLVETSPVGVVLVNKESSESTLVNREAARMLGSDFRVGEVLQEHARSAILRHGDGSEFEVSDLPLRRALNAGERVTAEEVRMELTNGTTIPTLVNATPLYDAEGAITGAIAVMQDITPIEELERLRNEFLGMVSHELKTPLTSIKGSAAIALGSANPLNADEARELFAIIDEQSNRLRDLVDNLLDVTRIEAGSLSVAPTPIELAPLFQDAAAVLVRSGGTHGLSQPDVSTLPTVMADSSRIGQVLNNLLSNAGKFSPEGSPIEIEVTQDKGHATIQVRDHGRGFAEGQAQHLFAKFSQLPDGSGRVSAGHGLGLAICKGIVEAHGGRIKAESPGLGKGSTFTFTLPLATHRAVSGEPVPDVTQRAAHLGRISRPGERARVLVIDDEPQLLRYVQRTLDDAGFKTITTLDPEEGARLVETEDPDMVLLDVQLPGTDGFEMLRRFREFSGVPVMFLTAQTDSELAARALRAGADDYVTKPFSPTELLARIEAALRRRVMPDQTEVRKPYRAGALEVDFADRRVTIDEQTVMLSATEYKLLLELASNAGRVLTHDQILHNVWGPEYSGESELVRSFIRNLRRKLGDDARNPRYILTEPQVGYRMPRPTA